MMKKEFLELLDELVDGYVAGASDHQLALDEVTSALEMKLLAIEVEEEGDG